MGTVVIKDRGHGRPGKFSAVEVIFEYGFENFFVRKGTENLRIELGSRSFDGHDPEPACLLEKIDQVPDIALRLRDPVGILNHENNTILIPLKNFFDRPDIRGDF